MKAQIIMQFTQFRGEEGDPTQKAEYISMQDELDLETSWHLLIPREIHNDMPVGFLTLTLEEGDTLNPEVTDEAPAEGNEVEG